MREILHLGKTNFHLKISNIWMKIYEYIRWGNKTLSRKVPFTVILINLENNFLYKLLWGKLCSRCSILLGKGWRKHSTVIARHVQNEMKLVFFLFLFFFYSVNKCNQDNEKYILRSTGIFRCCLPLSYVSFV